jgi:L-ascorbate metabolism protein UlaG (beta-lactamase superfamily)
MAELPLRITYIGGPTALLEVAGLRLLTDPTFDPAGSEYPTPIYTLRKQEGPALAADGIGPIDAVLLSHDHHFDNLDHAGRELVARAPLVLTTEAGAARLGRDAIGLAPWRHHDLTAPDGGVLRVTGAPARHGPADGDRGPVVGFVLADGADRTGVVYVSGDTVWFDGVAEVGRRFSVRVALLFMGAARVREVGTAHLTFTAAEGVEAARALGDALIVPLHVEGWAHFSESRAEIASAFEAAGLAHRLRWLEGGRPATL